MSGVARAGLVSAVRQVALVGWLTLLWLVLWRDFTLANALSGLAAAVAVTALFPGGRRVPVRHTLRPHWAVAAVVYFHWKLLEANYVLAREVVTPRDHTQSGIIAVPVTGLSDLLVTLIANAITLTPGTVTLDVQRGEPSVLYVHVLHLHDVERVRREVHQLQHLALRAFGAKALIDDHYTGSHQEVT